MGLCQTPEGRQILKKEEQIPFSVNWLGWSANALLTPKEIRQKTAETASYINLENQELVENFLRQLSQDPEYTNQLQNWASTIKGEILIPEGSRLSNIQMIMLGCQQNPAKAVNAMPEKLRNIWNKMPEHKELAKEIASFVDTAKGKINEKYFSHSNQEIHWACMDKDGKIYDFEENEAVEWLFQTIVEKTGIYLS